ncbi:aldo/keto reductase [Corynebacterium oculi]|uniref:Putative oxidoreductase n=1 Tax=Corynebacterium oculi TaxID=1544416 RepID=A0A0Q0Z7H4_9CORY|nr:aldo/keto reductase [Corynebacterium oculi]KQB85518.1 putative oxidoreductase [Corynebacterium oculi]
MQNLTLNNGVDMPILGLGVFQMNDEQVAQAIPEALNMGYRLIDTASRYYNEKAVGAAIKASGVPREELFITTKLWFKDHGPEATRAAFETSLDNLGLDYLDLWLIHQPFGDYYSAWRVMEELLAEGRVRAIGVSNFYADRYADLVTHMDVAPAVNQRETHPFHQQRDMQELMSQHGTALQAWGSLGQGNREMLEHPVLTGIAQAHEVSVPQVMLAWLAQRGVAMVAKSTKPERLRANLEAVELSLSAEEIEAIAGLDRRQPNAGFTHQDPRMLEALLRLA